jgi:hypothetical protein
MEIAKITIAFTPGVSAAYPTELDFLRDYLPTVCAKRPNYNMGSLARDLDISPSNLSNKLGGSGDYDFGSKYKDKLKRILTPQEYLPIIGYEIDATQREYNEIAELKRRLAELESGQ